MKNEITIALTKIETSRYAALKTSFKIWWADMELARASLTEIRDKKLYREEYGTFMEFCISEYGILSRQANRIIKGESGKSLTSSSMEDSTMSTESSNNSEGSSGNHEPEKTIELDSVGVPIPDEILEDWKRSKETAKEMVSVIQKVCNDLRKGVESRDKIFREFSENVVTQAEGLRYTIKSHLGAYAVCPFCHGKNSKKCDACSERGFVSKYFWDSPAVPTKLKEMISKNKKS